MGSDDDGSLSDYSPPSRNLTSRGSADFEAALPNRRVKQREPRPPKRYTAKKYDDLPKRPGAIRILRLYSSTSDNPQIECELLTPSEKDIGPPVPYEALSWCWGSEPADIHYLSIRKGQKIYAKYVAPNLFSALRALRHDRKNRNLWIDAVCINQDNLDEKNHQVERMDEIYGNAERVCIWLGDPTTSSRLALKFIEKEVLKLQDFDQLCSSRKHSDKWSALLELMQRDWFSRRWVVQEIALAQEAVIYCGTDQISWSKFAVAVELFVEVETATHRLSEVMKKNPKYYHVPGWFEYVSALGASLLVDATGRLFRDFKEERQADEASLEDNPDSESDSNPDDQAESDTPSEAEVDSRATRSTDRVRVRSDSARLKIRRNKGQPLLGLEYLVSSLAIFQTTVPHDTIYALLAIAKDTTPIAAETDTKKTSDHTQDVLEVFTQRKRYTVDYNAPYVDVCKDFIIFCIERNLQMDPSRALDVICRPWATEEKVLREKQQKERNRNKPPNRKRKGKQAQRFAEAPADTNRSDSDNKAEGLQANGSLLKPDSIPHRGGTSDDTKYMSLPSWMPQLSGAPYAMYLQAGAVGIKMSRMNADPLVGLPSTTQRNYAAAETKPIDMKCLKFRKRVDLDHYSMYVKGFVLDTVANVSQLARNGQIPQDWAELAGWPNADGQPPDAFWRTLVADRGRDGKNPPVYYSRACKESFTKGGYMGGAVNTTDLINYERNSVVAQFCRRVQAVVWNRALIKTNSGKLGLVGRNVQKDDEVAILYGCSVPVILRRSKRKDEAAFKQEILWELNFLTDTLRAYFKRWQQRRKEHTQRKEVAKKKIMEWEMRARRQFRRDKVWREQWRAKLKRESETDKRDGLIIYREYELPDKPNLDNPTTRMDAAINYLKILILNKDLRLSREFRAWKREKTIEAKRNNDRDWLPPGPDWAKFELRLKYGRIWKKRIRTRKKELRDLIEEEVTKKIEALTQAEREIRSKAEKTKAPKPKETKHQASIIVRSNSRLPSIDWSTDESVLTSGPLSVTCRSTKQYSEHDKFDTGPHRSNNDDSRMQAMKLDSSILPFPKHSPADRQIPKANGSNSSGDNSNQNEAPVRPIENGIGENATLRSHLQSVNPGKMFGAANSDGEQLSLDQHGNRPQIQPQSTVSRPGKAGSLRAESNTSPDDAPSTTNSHRPAPPPKPGNLVHRRTQSFPSPSRNRESANVVEMQQQKQQKPDVKGEGQPREQEHGYADQQGIMFGFEVPGLFDGDQDESDAEGCPWMDDTWKEAKKHKMSKQDSGNWNESQSADYWKRYRELENKKQERRDSWKDANWKQYQEQERSNAEEQLRERLGVEVIEDGKKRRRLTPEVAMKYNRRIGRNFRKKLGEDGYYSYTLLGECYIHGMMDGEAMAYQNGKNQRKEVVPTTTFEIR